jgi:hypothetical protein
MRRAGLVLLLLWACTPNWNPASVIDSLRVIGVRAEPPEIRPGQSAVLQQLLIEPNGKKTTTLWLGCDPDPFNEGRGACTDVNELTDPSTLVNTSALPGGVKLIGFNDQVTYSTDAHLFDVLDAGDPRRITGTVGLVVSIAVAEEVSPTATSQELKALADRVRSGQTESQLTLFRVSVSESPNPNHNPVADQLTVNVPLAPGQTALVEPVTPAALDLTAHDLEMYDEQTPSGVQHLTEHIIAAWYTNAGRFIQDRVELYGDVKSYLTGPGDDPQTDPVPPDHRGTLWAVIRDSRGGQAWATWPFWVCDHTLPAAVVRSADIAAGTLTLHGDHLDQVLDVLLDGGVVAGSFHADTGTWQGTLPMTPAGAYFVQATNKGCDFTGVNVTLQ